MGKRKRLSKQIKEDLERRLKIKELISQGYELNEAIIMTQKKLNQGKSDKIRKHFNSIKNFKGIEKNIENAKRKRNKRKTPIIPVGFEYKKK